MRVAVFSAKPFERTFLTRANQRYGHELVYFESTLSEQTLALAAGFTTLCTFVNDKLDAATLAQLAAGGTRLLALRSAGFNNVDIKAADSCGITVLRVPAYSPHAVAEHTVGLMLTLNRKFHRAYNRVREQNFALDGLMGFDMNGKTVGIIGTGKIGEIVGNIVSGFGCRVLAYDVKENPVCLALGAKYCSLDELATNSDIITLHCPLTPETHHLVGKDFLKRTKHGVMLINTSRGGVVDTLEVIRALKSGQVGTFGIDVYEEEADLFFRDLSESIIQDDVFARLLAFPNVIVTAHQGFFTREALENIAQTTLQNIADFEKGQVNSSNLVTERHVQG